MRSNTVRFALAASGLAAVGLVGGAHAATTPKGPSVLVLTDKTGDNAAPGLKGDIAKVTYTTKGKTAKVGKNSIYTPQALVVSMELADAVNTTGDVEYEVDAKLEGCGSFHVYTTPGVSDTIGPADAVGGSVGCGGTGSLDPLGLIPTTSTSLTPDVVIAGKTITFTVEFSQYPDALKAGAKISATDAFTAEVEPAAGIFGPYMVDSTFYTDELAADDVYKIG